MFDDQAAATAVGPSGTAGPARARTVGRYLIVSLINTVNHQAVLFVANSVWGWSGGWANVLAGCVAAFPAYLLSRAWVWGVDGKHDFRTEIVPFWLLALAGLAVSTGMAEAADRLFGSGIAVNLASLTGYFVVWVVKFFLLDRLFAARPHQEER